MNPKSIVIFTDGSSKGNPGPGGFGAIVVWQDNVQELGGKDDHTTNNRMELTAAIEALGFCLKLQVTSYRLQVFSDSKYLIEGITKWVFNWQKNGWRTVGKKDVENRDLWEKLFEASKNFNIEWIYVAGHTGHPLNERCDEIATLFADDNLPKLYVGPKDKYFLDTDKKETVSGVRKNKKSNTGKVYSYLSLINGQATRHTTWVECEARVKGVGGAKWKKTTSAEDEKDILSDWGVPTFL